MNNNKKIFRSLFLVFAFSCSAVLAKTTFEQLEPHPDYKVPDYSGYDSEELELLDKLNSGGLEDKVDRAFRIKYKTLLQGKAYEAPETTIEDEIEIGEIDYNEGRLTNQELEELDNKELLIRIVEQLHYLEENSEIFVSDQRRGVYMEYAKKVGVESGKYLREGIGKLREKYGPKEMFDWIVKDEARWKRQDNLINKRYFELTKKTK